MAFSLRSFVDLSVPIAGVPIIAIRAPLAEPPLLPERRAQCALPAAPFPLERRARALAQEPRAHGGARSCAAVRAQPTVAVGLPRKPPSLPPRRQPGPAVFVPCAAPRRA